MPLAMANAAGITNHNYLIFRKSWYISYWPRVHQFVWSSHSFIYNQYGLGHYDAVKPIHLQTSVTPTPQHCRCGINKKSATGVSCNNVIGQYSTYCKCYKWEQPCTDVCKCHKCSNPFGARPASVDQHVWCPPHILCKEDEVYVKYHNNWWPRWNLCTKAEKYFPQHHWQKTAKSLLSKW